MSNVVISNRTIFNQRVGNIEQNKVLLPFNVTREQVKKIEELLSKIKVSFLVSQDSININNLSYNNINIKASDRVLENNRFTLSRTYVVTMKQSFISKVRNFYGRIIAPVVPERPIFNIGKETNLQEALQEATTEIDLSAINTNVNNIPNNNQTIPSNNMVEQPAQVLANNPLGETIIENPVNLNNQEQPMNTNVSVAPVVNTSPVQVQAPVAPVVPESNPVMMTPQPQVQPQPVINVVQPQQPVMGNPAIPNQPINQVTPEQPKVKVKKLKGSVLAVPIIVVWLGLVFYGTLKLVTSILT